MENENPIGHFKRLVESTERDTTKRTTLRLPVPLWQACEWWAIQDDQSLNGWITAALRRECAVRLNDREGWLSPPSKLA